MKYRASNAAEAATYGATAHETDQVAAATGAKMRTESARTTAKPASTSSEPRRKTFQLAWRTAAAAIGVCLVAAGVLLVRGFTHSDEGVLVALAIGCAIAGYTLVDKEGLQHAAALPYLELVLAPVGLVAVPVAAMRRGSRALRAQVTPSTVAASVAAFGAYALVLAALRLAPAPEVAAVRETSIVLATLLAAVFLRETVGLRRLAGAAVVAGGVALIALS